MKRIIIYRVVAVAVLLMVSSAVRAEMAGIKDLSECPIKDGAILGVKDKEVLIAIMSNLLPGQKVIVHQLASV